MGWQEALTWLVVAVALAYLVYKFVLEPRLRSRRPHVATRSIVRRNRASPPPGDDCCG